MMKNPLSESKIGTLAPEVIANGLGLERRAGSPGRLRRGSGRFLVAAVVLVFGATLPAKEKSPRWEELAAVPPARAVVDYAAHADIPTEGISIAEPGPAGDGDMIVMLVTLCLGQARDQWLATLTVAPLSESERALAPLPEQTIYTSTGRTLHFQRTRAALNVTLAGPFRADAAASGNDEPHVLVTRHRSLVTAEYLGLGLDHYAEVAERVSERARVAKAKDSDFYYIGSGSPLAKDILEKGKRYAQLARPTEQEEKLIFSVSFALNEFLAAALDVPDFRKTVEEVMNKPSVWSILANFGAGQFLDYDARNVTRVTAGAYPFPLPVYQLPIKLSYNGRLALRANLLMSAARPPLEACGGLVGVFAENPTSSQKRLLIRVIATRPAGGHSP